MTATAQDLSLTPAERRRSGIAADQPLFFDAVLRPHRSLTPGAFTRLMTAIVLISAVMALRFTVIGAWPVAGFMILDVLLLYGAFRLSYATGRAFESIQLRQRELVVTRVNWRGRVHTTTFQPAWTRAELDRTDRGRPRLFLSSRGRRVAVGDCLGPAEREDLAAALTDALADHRTGRRPSGPGR